MKYSIIVPIYNVEKYIKKCINSILHQTYKNFEVILVDDGSPDNCPQICDDYSLNDNRVKVIHKKNGGLVSARNIGILNSSGDYVVYVDGDDWIEETLLEEVDKILQLEENIDMVCYTGVRQYNDRYEPLPFDITEGLYCKNDLQTEIYPYMMYDCRKKFCNGLIFPVAWNKVYKRELLLNHYCKDERIRMGEDNAFVFECLFYAEKVYFLNKKLYFYNQFNSFSMTSNYDEYRFENNVVLFEYLEKNLGNIDNVLDEQLNAFKAYWLMMAIFHEVKSKRPMRIAANHIKNKINQYKLLEGINAKNLPLSAKVYYYLLKMKLYYLMLIFTKFICFIRK